MKRKKMPGGPHSRDVIAKPAPSPDILTQAGAHLDRMRSANADLLRSLIHALRLGSRPSETTSPFGQKNV